MSALFLILNSCGSKKDIPLEIATAQSDIYFIHGEAKSCQTMYEGSSAGETYDIQKSYFQLSQLELVWTESGTKFNLSYIRMTLASPFIENSPLTIILPPGEISYLTGVSATPWTPRMDNSASVIWNCPLKFGGINIINNQAFSTQAVIDFVGFKYKVDSNNEIYDEEPVTLTKVVSIQNL